MANERVLNASDSQAASLIQPASIQTKHSTAGLGDGPPKLKVALVGGSDVGQRVELVNRLGQGFNLCVLGPDRSLAPSFNRVGAEYRFYPMTRGVSPWKDLMTIAALVRHFRSIRPDIVHTYDSKPCALGRLAAWISRVPVIIGTYPGMGSLYATNSLRVRLTRFIYERVQTLACLVSTLTIVQNADDLEDLVARGVIARSKAMIVRGSGVNTKRFKPVKPSAEDASRLRTTLGIGQESLIVTMVSRIMRTKGVLEYARAATQTGRKLGNVECLLIGRHDQESLDRLQPGELDLLKRAVRVLGPRGDIPEVLSITDIFVLPSFSMEGIPRVLLEAAACGVPIVTTDTRGCRDVVRDGISGILVPPGDADALAVAILSLLADPKRRLILGREARKRVVEEFDLNIISSQLTKVYFKLAATVSPSPAEVHG